MKVTIMKKFTFIVTVLAASVCAASLASAQGWELSSTATEFKVKKNIIHTQTIPTNAELLSPQGKAKRGDVEFMCLNGELFTSIYLGEAAEDTGFLDVFVTRQRGIQTIPRRIDFEGKKNSTANWLPLNDNSLMIAYSPSISRKLYNSAITGNSVVFAPGDAMEAQLNLPKIDKVFATFGAECGLGNKAKKSS